GDANPGIADRDLDQPVLWRGRNLDPPTLRRELDGVGQQVEDDLTDLPLVRLNLAQPLVNAQVEGDAPSPNPLADQSQSAVECRREMEVGEFQLHPPGFDLRQVEDVVDQRQQVRARRIDVLQILVLLLVQLPE